MKVLADKLDRIFGSDPDLSYLLDEPGRVSQIGPEKADRWKSNGIVRYDSPHGSYRYVKYYDGLAVAALQVMSKDGKGGHVANVFTHPDYRRKGFATELLKRAEKDFGRIAHSDQLSDSAKKWLKK